MYVNLLPLAIPPFLTLITIFGAFTKNSEVGNSRPPLTSNIYWEYMKTVKILGTRFGLNEKDVVLAFDYTDEDFYGDPQGFWIHGWTGEKAVTGKWKFLTCAIVSSDIPQKSPLISVPVRMGHNMAHTVAWCLSVVEPLVKSISLILFDRGFYSKELMLTLAKIKH